MYLETLNKIQYLEQSDFNCERDKNKIWELYEIILDCCSNKDNYMQQSAETLDLLEENRLDNTGKNLWVNYSSNVFASYLAIKLYEDKSIASPEALDCVIHYYRSGNFPKEVVSTGLYACAQTLDFADPMRCYQLTKEAFSINPHLGNILDIHYCYEGEAAVEHITDSCPFCGSKEAVPYYCSPQVLKLNNNKVFPPSKLWMKCSHCNNYYTYNFPLMSTGDINGHYTKNLNNEILQHRFPLHIYNPIFTRMRELTSGSDYLEIGIGNGEMLAVAQEFGYHTDAVEICKADCERVASGLDIDIKWCDIVNYHTEKKYDVIVMGDVLEHVTAPADVLQKVQSMLKPDGILWLSTPNYNCAYARMQKFTHCMWHELNHYTYTSYETLCPLLNELGMEVIHYDMSSRYIGSMELFIRNTKDSHQNHTKQNHTTEKIAYDPLPNTHGGTLYHLDCTVLSPVQYQRKTPESAVFIFPALPSGGLPKQALLMPDGPENDCLSFCYTLSPTIKKHTDENTGQMYYVVNAHTVEHTSNRDEVRVSVSFPISAQFDDSPSEMTVMVKNISAGGFFFVSEKIFQPGTTMSFIINNYASLVWVTAIIRKERLVRTPGLHGYGCQFCNLSERTESAIRNYVFHHEILQRKKTELDL